jgi:hypothetical protein
MELVEIDEMCVCHSFYVEQDTEGGAVAGS